MSCRKVSCCVLASTPGFQAPDRSSRRGDGVLVGVGLPGPVRSTPPCRDGPADRAPAAFSGAYDAHSGKRSAPQRAQTQQEAKALSVRRGVLAVIHAKKQDLRAHRLFLAARGLAHAVTAPHPSRTAPRSIPHDGRRGEPHREETSQRRRGEGAARRPATARHHTTLAPRRSSSPPSSSSAATTSPRPCSRSPTGRRPPRTRRPRRPSPTTAPYKAASFHWRLRRRRVDRGETRPARRSRASSSRSSAPC